jgi:transcriptional regulator with XRE-family HTH domain
VAEASTLAETIQQLFKTIRKSPSQEHSMSVVAQWCAEWIRERDGQGTFSRQYLYDLRAGVKTNPGKRHLEALAAFFEVDPAIFFDSEKAKQIQADLELAAAIRDAGVSALALRAVGLTPADRQEVLALMQSLAAKQARSTQD